MGAREFYGIREGGEERGEQGKILAAVGCVKTRKEAFFEESLAALRKRRREQGMAHWVGWDCI